MKRTRHLVAMLVILLAALPHMLLASERSEFLDGLIGMLRRHSGDAAGASAVLTILKRDETGEARAGLIRMLDYAETTFENRKIAGKRYKLYKEAVAAALQEVANQAGGPDQAMQFLREFERLAQWTEANQATRPELLAKLKATVASLADYKRTWSEGGEIVPSNSYQPKGGMYALHRLYKLALEPVDGTVLMKIEPGVNDGKLFRDALIEVGGEQWYIEFKNWSPTPPEEMLAGLKTQARRHMERMVSDAHPNRYPLRASLAELDELPGLRYEFAASVVGADASIKDGIGEVLRTWGLTDVEVARYLDGMPGGGGSKVVIVVEPLAL